MISDLRSIAPEGYRPPWCLVLKQRSSFERGVVMLAKAEVKHQFTLHLRSFKHTFIPQASLRSSKHQRTLYEHLPSEEIYLGFHLPR
jgi:hypothetical protein